MATARGWDSEDDEFPSTAEDPDIEDLIAFMEESFPSISRRLVRRTVENHGPSNAQRITDELVRMSDDVDDVSGLRRAFSRFSPSARMLRMQSVARFLDDRPTPRDFSLNTAETGSPEVTLETMSAMFRGVLPDADPDYIMMKAVELGEDEANATEWLENALQNRDYPTLMDYLKRRESKDTIQRYAKMEALEFLEMFPEGEHPASSFSKRSAPSESYKANVAVLVRMLFPDAKEDVVEKVLSDVKGLLVPAVNCMELNGHDRGELPSYEAFDTGSAIDIAFIQEMTFLRLEVEIEAIVHIRRMERERAKAEARKAGTLFECPICADDDVLVTDVLTCSVEQHKFCSRCVKRQAETAASEARSVVSCLEHGCEGFYPLSRLYGIITPSLFSSLLKAVQQSELKEAALDGLLEACPFCSFSCEIENEKMEVFKCLNPLCRIDSCRKCKKVAHSSIACNEVETDQQTQARLLLEEKLTSAIVRNCPTCSKEVLKVEGCNHMTCPCGTDFCYVCRQLLLDVWEHYEDGSCDQFESSDVIHGRDLSRAVIEGKEELGSRFGALHLVHDPTTDIPEPEMEQPSRRRRRRQW